MYRLPLISCPKYLIECERVEEDYLVQAGITCFLDFSSPYYLEVLILQYSTFLVQSSSLIYSWKIQNSALDNDFILAQVSHRYLVSTCELF